MRFDKLTKFQQALADAQSIAVGNDQQFIEPLHVLQALDLNNLLNLTDKGSDQTRRPVHRQRDVPAGARRRQGRTGRMLKDAGLRRKALEVRDRGGARRRRRRLARRPKASARR